MNWIDCLKIFGVAGVVTVILIPAICRICFRFGFLDLPGEHKRHRFPTPNLGGVAIFAGFWAAIIFAFYHYPAIGDELGPVLYFVIAGAVIVFMIGIIDDLTELSAPIKLAGQIIAGIIVYTGGIQISTLFIPLYGPIELGYLSLPVTLLWFLGVMNSINLIDGLDGLAAGVAAIAALAILFVGVAFELVTAIVFSTAIIGTCVTFLYYNHYPAKIFMGDSGSLFLGYIFAIISIVFPIKSYTTAAVFVPLLALGVPIIETTVSFIRRVATGHKFYEADNRHLFHYLGALGLSKAKVLWTFYLVSAVFAVFSGAMFIFDKRIVMAILAIFMVVIFGILFRFRLARSNNSMEDENK
ncbi:MAG: undecaprenyl/decaprenyl-phosphate alpha-N-acetylglucosaminyl 1-phosphate transferase [candidate division Zixibacteria bacterium]|nr:undecaprenyl/decaprenyl-phosphate alpha-N-acetylglucosaminyl 1-phosphate transferase [candidate division Zixibacteria bacterium]